MDRNVEEKFQLLNPQKTLELLHLKLKEGIIHKVSGITQKDTFYHVTNGRLKWRQINELNINSYGPTYELIWYQREDKPDAKMSNFIRLPVDKNIEAAKLLLLNAHDIICEVHKERLVYMYGQTRIHFDHVMDLGRFVELEVVLNSDQNIEDGKKIINEIKTMLLLHEDKQISCAYADLLLNKK
jgi:predicted adenylyl cyclase CyaB